MNFTENNFSLKMNFVFKSNDEKSTAPLGSWREIDESRPLTKLKPEKQNVKKLSREELICISLLFQSVEWRKQRYTNQLWDKLRNPSFIKSIATRIKEAANKEKNYVKIPVIYIYWNKIDCKNNLRHHSVCDKLFSTYFPNATLSIQMDTIYILKMDQVMKYQMDNIYIIIV